MITKKVRKNKAKVKRKKLKQHETKVMVKGNKNC